jgi:hypothetical protein
MVNENQVALLQQGVAEWNERKGPNRGAIDLREANLSGAALYGAVKSLILRVLPKRFLFFSGWRANPIFQSTQKICMTTHPLFL